MTSNDFLIFGKPDISEMEVDAVAQVLRSGWLSTGKVSREFESEFEKFVGKGKAVAVSSCTDALTLSLMAAGVNVGDEVITSPLTFAATVNAILSVGALPVFVDVDEGGQMDSENVEGAITERTVAIIPVHYTGGSPNMADILRLAKEYDLTVIEDAAHGLGGYYGENHLGTLGDFGCFSFYPTKNITSGEGGMVVVPDRETAEQVRVLSMNGLSANAYLRYGKERIKGYEVADIGIKGNMSDVHAAIGLTQLRRWKDLSDKRFLVWNVYASAFGAKFETHSKHLYTIHHQKRDDLREFLYEKGIGTGIHFNPLHLEPAYSFLGHGKGDFPNAELIGETTVSLPLSSSMKPEDAERVVEAVKSY